MSQKTQHTPAPWKVYRREVDELVILSDDRSTLAEVFAVGSMLDNVTPYANAHLMAAAPELLNACESMFALFRSQYSTSPEATDALNAAKAAIAKAKGPQ